MGTTHVKHVGGMAFVGEGASGHPIKMDASVKAGGAEAAPSPIEALLSSLGGCTGMDVLSLLRKMKTEPRGFSIEIRDERASEYPKEITKIHLLYRLTGDVPEENVAKAIDLSLSKYCPVAGTLRGTAEITSSYEIQRDQ